MPETDQWDLRVNTAARTSDDPDLYRDDGLIDISRPEQLILPILDRNNYGIPD